MSLWILNNAYTSVVANDLKTFVKILRWSLMGLVQMGRPVVQTKSLSIPPQPYQALDLNCLYPLLIAPRT
jgi:hypothetical protein